MKMDVREMGIMIMIIPPASYGVRFSRDDGINAKDALVPSYFGLIARTNFLQSFLRGGFTWQLRLAGEFESVTLLFSFDHIISGCA